MAKRKKSAPKPPGAAGKMPAMGAEMIDRGDGGGMKKSLPFGGGKKMQSDGPPKTAKKKTRKKK